MQFCNSKINELLFYYRFLILYVLYFIIVKTTSTSFLQTLLYVRNIRNHTLSIKTVIAIKSKIIYGFFYGFCRNMAFSIYAVGRYRYVLFRFIMTVCPLTTQNMVILLFAIKIEEPLN